MSNSAENDGIDVEQFMKAAENMGAVVSVFSGMKKQFVDQGWSEDHAEAMVVQVLEAANLTNREKLEKSGNRVQRRAGR